jgi:GNAT superfamily N-acetyltransferase
MRRLVAHLRQVNRRFGALHALWALACLTGRRLYSFSVWGCFVRDAGATPTVPPIADGHLVEELGPEQLRGLGQHPGYDLSPAFLEAWSRDPGACFGIRDGSRWLGYAFFARAPTLIDTRFRFSFPADCGYVFKTFTLPEARGLGLGKRCIAGGMRRLACRPGWPARWACLIESTNYTSIRCFEQIGFRRAGWLFLRGAMPFHTGAALSPAARRLGFAVSAP